VAIDAAGTAYIGWQVNTSADTGDAVQLCVLPAGARACASLATIAFPGSGYNVGAVSVLLPAPGVVQVAVGRNLQNVYGYYLGTSVDGGATFNTPIRIGGDFAMRAELLPGGLIAAQGDARRPHERRAAARGSRVDRSRSVAGAAGHRRGRQSPARPRSDGRSGPHGEQRARDRRALRPPLDRHGVDAAPHHRPRERQPAVRARRRWPPGRGGLGAQSAELRQPRAVLELARRRRAVVDRGDARRHRRHAAGPGDGRPSHRSGVVVGGGSFEDKPIDVYVVDPHRAKVARARFGSTTVHLRADDGDCIPDTQLSLRVQAARGGLLVSPGTVLRAARISVSRSRVERRGRWSLLVDLRRSRAKRTATVRLVPHHGRARTLRLPVRGCGRVA
jgi:hypothetical protein